MFGYVGLVGLVWQVSLEGLIGQVWFAAQVCKDCAETLLSTA